MVATWLTELYLDRINRALLEDGEGGEGGPQVKELTSELREFLRQRVELLDVRTTMNLLASYGRLEDLMHYASYRQVRPGSRRPARPAACQAQRNPASRALLRSCWPTLHCWG